MLTRSCARVHLAAWALLLAASGACEKVPLLAPTGSTITLTAAATALSANGTTSIVGQVLEAAGTPPHSGTHVTFTTTLGKVEPSDVSTDVNGRVSVTFVANGANGTATINAIPGGASTSAATGGTAGTTGAVKIAVGAAAVGKVIVGASPAAVSSQGGSTTVTATVLDINGTPLVGAPVSFTTTAGVLSLGTVVTDASGAATSVLTTSAQATVTASVGAQSTATTGTGTGASTSSNFGTVTVNINTAPTIAIKLLTAAVIKGVPATFTFTVTAGTGGGSTGGTQAASAVREVSVNWGDGVSESLGSFTGSSDQTHTFKNDGTFRVTGTVTDASGTGTTASVSVSVGEATGPTVKISAPDSITKGVPAAFTFTVEPDAATKSPVRQVTVNWGDGTSENLGSGLTPKTTHAFSAEGALRVTVTAADALGNSGTASTSVTVGQSSSPSITVASSPATPGVGTEVTFTITITVPGGLGVQSTTINFGDGTTNALGGVSGTISQTHSYSSLGTKSVEVTVIDAAGKTTKATTSVTIS